MYPPGLANRQSSVFETGNETLTNKGPGGEHTNASNFSVDWSRSTNRKGRSAAGTQTAKMGSMTANQRLSGGTGYALERIEIFKGLEPREIERLSQRMHWRNYAAQQQIIGHQEISTDVYFMVSGTVRVILFSSAGKEVAFRDISAGECFGEFSAIDGAPRSANVIALTDVMIGSVPAETFRSILEEYPPVSMAMLTYLTRLVRSLSERIFEFSTLAVKNRIHSELLRLARDNVGDDNTAHLSPAPTHADIASRISTHREAVTRELNDLTKAGLIKRDGRTLIVSDVAELERMVHEVSGD